MIQLKNKDGHPGNSITEKEYYDPLKGRKVYVPQMSVEGTACVVAALRAIGLEAEVYPAPDEETLRLGGQLTSGDECYPQIITLGNFLKIVKDKDFDPDRTAFFMATSGGPCRFGQYVPFMKKVFRDMGYSQVPIFSPMADTGYGVYYSGAADFPRMAMRALMCGDILRKLLLKTRPYEINSGETDRVHQECLQLICKIIEIPEKSSKEKMQDLLCGLEEIRDRFRKIKIKSNRDKLFIGVVGEIYCRLEEFSNNFLIRTVERLGGEIWIANISEWLTYVNFMHTHRLTILNKTFSKDMLKMRIKTAILHSDEKKLYKLFKDDFRGYEEADHVGEILARGAPYLPYRGALGEMALSVGTSLYFYEKGIDGIIDISPFTCMNGIITEAVYPKISKDHNNLPMRVFYFDGTETNMERDVSIFLDLARTYRRRKKKTRVYPRVFY
ncbi:MAG: hypothetical protein ACE5HS_16100 [bacterium]